MISRRFYSPHTIKADGKTIERREGNCSNRTAACVISDQEPRLAHYVTEPNRFANALFTLQSRQSTMFNLAAFETKFELKDNCRPLKIRTE